MNTWKRLDGPTKISLDESGTGDDARGDYAWSSLYGCGRARCEVTHTLTVADLDAEWGNDGDEDAGRVFVTEVAHSYTVDLEGNPDESYDEFQYETPGLYDYELSDAERAYTALDEMASHDMAWAFCGPETKAQEVYERQPAMVWWNEAMKAGEG
jgi:hypothetical protein